jgi:hypothetical protein
MADNYLIWTYKSVDGACVLGEFAGVDDTRRLQEGEPYGDDFPSAAALHMHPDYPKDLLLVDNLLNSDYLQVVSAKLRDFLQKQKLADVEYLPVSIIDHRGRVASKDYSILHTLRPVDCIDRAKSDFKESRIVPGRISRFKKLVLDEAKVPAGRQLFGLKNFGLIAMVGAALAKKLDAEKFTGLGWTSVAKYRT